MAGTLRLSNTGTGNGQSTITTAASGDTTYTLPSGGGTFVTTSSTQALTVPFASGTVSAPSITFLGDSNTGIYSPAADTIAFTEGGVESLRIDSSGRVGIGTSSPNDKLDISTGNIRLTDGYTLQWGGTSTFINGYNAGILQLCTGSTPRLYINSSGNVGIGTSTPSCLLNTQSSSTGELARFATSATSGEVNISVGFTTTNQFRVGYDTATGDGILQTNAGGSSLLFKTINTERARIDSSGRLLVGTSSARSNYRGTVTPTLQLEETADNGIAHFVNTNTANGPFLWLGKSRGTAIGSNTIVQNDDSLGAVRFNGADGTNVILGAQIAANVDGTPGANDLPTRLVFSTTADGASSPTERMRITNNGYLKIANDNSYTGIDTNAHGVRQGTGNNWTWMTVNDTATPFGINIYYPGAAPNGTGNTFLRCQDSSNIRLEIRSNGGLVNYQANDVNLSDINSKKDITPAAGTWDCIKEWEIVNYRYKDQPDDADLNLGVIAQQVAESCPEVITVFSEATEDQPEKLGVKEQQMYWMAIKTLQEAQVRIEQLETSNADLLARVTALESA